MKKDMPAVIDENRPEAEASGPKIFSVL